MTIQDYTWSTTIPGSCAFYSEDGFPVYHWSTYLLQNGTNAMISCKEDMTAGVPPGQQPCPGGSHTGSFGSGGTVDPPVFSPFHGQPAAGQNWNVGVRTQGGGSGSVDAYVVVKTSS
jgi:hypothetical protein